MGLYTDLIAYRKGYELTMKVYHITLKFPKEERYSLTDQIRCSTRSVCANIAEAYRRRKYSNYFLSKLADSDTENAETQVWIDFSLDCKYITADEHLLLTNLNNETGKLIWYMMNNPEKFQK